MIYYFYPLESVWGSAGEWAAAVVALITGFFVWRLGTKANGIATSAQRIANDAERREGRLLLIYISTEISQSLVLVQGAKQRLGELLADAQYATDKAFRQRLHRDTTGMAMGTVQLSLQRLHVLPNEVGSALATALGIQRALQGETFRAIDQDAEEDGFSSHKKLVQMLGELEEQLQIVNSACRQALGKP